MEKRIIKFLALFVILSMSFSLFGCQKYGERDYDGTNTFINEETEAIDNEYVFKVLSITESNIYKLNETLVESIYENGVFLKLEISVRRKVIEKPIDREIKTDWFKLKKSKGFTLWYSNIGNTFKVNDHVNSKETSFDSFTPVAAEIKTFYVIFELGQDYLDTQRILTLEIDRPFSKSSAKEVVLIVRPQE